MMYRDELESAQAEARKARREMDELRKQVREKLWPSRFHYWFMLTVAFLTMATAVTAATVADYECGRTSVAERATWNAEWTLKERDYTLADILLQLRKEQKLADELKGAVDVLARGSHPPTQKVDSSYCPLAFNRLGVTTACADGDTCRGDTDDCRTLLAYYHWTEARQTLHLNVTSSKGVTP